MFQLEYGSEKVSKAFKEFTEKYLKIQPLVGWHADHRFQKNQSAENFTILVGFPDELTTPEFLDKLYAKLKLTGDEGFYKMSQRMKQYSIFILNRRHNPIFMKNLSKTAKYVFKECGKNRETPIFNIQYIDPCELENNLQMFKVKDTLYPVFHPDRPYFVNLAYMFYHIAIYGGYLYNIIYFDLQSHYSKYIELFGKEQNLPGFLLTNLQMLEVIRYQSRCGKGNDGKLYSNTPPPGYIFNCPQNN